MKWRIPLIFVALVLSGCFLSSDKNAQRIVAQVGDYKLSLQDFSRGLAQKLKNYDSVTVKNFIFIDKVKEDIISAFITESLLRNWSKKQNIIVTAEELQTEVTRLVSGYPDDYSLRQSLIEADLSYKDWEKKIYVSLLKQKVMARLTDRLDKPSEDELKAYYKENKAQFVIPAGVKLQQIVLNTEADAQRIVKEIRRGKKFGKLAQEFSIAPEATEAGMLGWINKDAAGIFKPAFGRPIGRVRKIVKSAFGYHILKVLKKRAKKQLTYSQAKNQIVERMNESRAPEAFSQWLENELKSIKVYIDRTLQQSVLITTEG